MIESITMITKTGTQYPVSNQILNNKMLIEITSLLNEELVCFDIAIIFKNPIIKFRNHDYTWVDCNVDRIACEYSPKIIQLNNNQYVQANQNIGIWEIKKHTPNLLLWRFNPQNAYPIAYFSETNRKTVIQTNQYYNFSVNPSLLFFTGKGIEFSRSKYPFSAIACFTDHCDFDTLEQLEIQRSFFNANNIKVTKGFFLKYFSKLSNNASYEHNSNELNNWYIDGHELAYHSLSQSIKTNSESFDDFYSFRPPINKISTWIDHGYQPYNFTKNNNIKNIDFSNNLKKNNIKILWNYIDSGTSTIGVINQLNCNDFTLKSFYKGIKKSPIKEKVSWFIKNMMFHYYADSNLIYKYKNTANTLKKLKYQVNISLILKFLKNLILIIFPFIKTFISWKTNKNKFYKLAKYSPLLFKHKIGENQFYVFQTLEMVDFKLSLCNENIEKLIKESGVFIAHTYFAVPMSYHSGKIFKTPSEIDTIVAQNFNFLGEKIRNKSIWNPTISEFVNYISNFDKALLDIDNNGNVIVINTSGLFYRQI